jgi:hypothetical protein
MIKTILLASLIVIAIVSTQQQAKAQDMKDMNKLIQDVVKGNMSGVNDLIKKEAKSFDEKKVQGINTCLDHVKQQGKFDTSDDITAKCDINMSSLKADCNQAPKPQPLAEERLCNNANLTAFFALRNATK